MRVARFNSLGVRFYAWHLYATQIMGDQSVMQELTAAIRGFDDPYGMLFHDLSDSASVAYGKITRGEVLANGEKAAVEELVSWGLVALDPDQPGTPIALDPQEAVRRRTNAQLHQLAQQASRILKGPEVADRLGADFDRAKWQTRHGCLYLVERGEVNARIQDVFAGARSEILTAQPSGPRTKEHRDIALQRDRDALRRGVKLRTLYRDSVRSDVLTREWAHTMTSEGAAYRTLADPFEKMIIVDRRIAFIRDHIGGNDSPDHAAWQVVDRPMVAFVAAVFDEFWRRASPWVGEAAVTGLPGGAGTRTTRLQRAILRDTAAGIQQDITHKRLGISLRRLQRELAELKEQWHAPTLAALTYQWATSPDRNIHDGPGVPADLAATAAESAA
jgi:hypothetical protein